jgi:choline monooxygenase
VLQTEKRHMFFRTWQFACHTKDLPEVGSFVTVSVFEQDIVIIHGHDDQIRAFYNVCAHRGHQLVEGSGQVRRLVCPYHAWTYELTGQLVGVRRGEGTTRIVKIEICLPHVRVEQVLDFVFINLDPDAEPLEHSANGLADEIEAACPGVRDFVATDT